MGRMYAWKCDLCGAEECRKDPWDFKGRAYTENSEQKYACQKCDALMRASIEIGAKGLKNPLAKVAGLIKQRDHARREAEEAKAALAGENPTVGYRNAAFRSAHGIEAAARIARGIADSHRLAGPEAPQALPGPKSGQKPERRPGRKGK